MDVCDFPLKQTTDEDVLVLPDDPCKCEDLMALRMVPPISGYSFPGCMSYKAGCTCPGRFEHDSVLLNKRQCLTLVHDPIRRTSLVRRSAPQVCLCGVILLSIKLGETNTPRRTRTPNLLIRSQTPYPIGPWAHVLKAPGNLDVALRNVND